MWYGGKYDRKRKTFHIIQNAYIYLVPAYLSIIVSSCTIGNINIIIYRKLTKIDSYVMCIIYTYVLAINVFLNAPEKLHHNVNINLFSSRRRRRPSGHHLVFLYIYIYTPIHFCNYLHTLLFVVVSANETSLLKSFIYNAINIY